LVLQLHLFCYFFGTATLERKSATSERAEHLILKPYDHKSKRFTLRLNRKSLLLELNHVVGSRTVAQSVNSDTSK